MSELLAVSVLEKLQRPAVERLVVAISGGVDSAALLHAVSKAITNVDVQGLHVHHGLVSNANQLAAAAQRNCDACHVPLIIKSVEVASGGSVEMAAREARYAAFREFLLSGDLLLLAHHADDQVETALFRLFRGSRVTGIQGMPEERQLGLARLYRPLLKISRQKILDYALTHNLFWVEDDSNADLSFDRNYIRRSVLPVIESRWPEIRQRLLSAIERDSKAQSIMLGHHSGLLDSVRFESDCLDVEALRLISESELVDLLGTWLNQLGVSMQTGRFLRQIANTLISCNTVDVRSGEVEIRQHKGRIYALKKLPFPTCEEFRLALGVTHLAGGVLRNVNIEGVGLRPDDYCVRFRQGGESLRQRHNRSLKNVYQASGLPAWLRPRLPLIYKDLELVAIAGIPSWNFSMQIADGYGVTGSEIGLNVDLLLEDRF